ARFSAISVVNPRLRPFQSIGLRTYHLGLARRQMARAGIAWSEALRSVDLLAIYFSRRACLRIGRGVVHVLHAGPANTTEDGEKGEAEEAELHHRFHHYCKSTLHAVPR